MAAHRGIYHRMSRYLSFCQDDIFHQLLTPSSGRETKPSISGNDTKQNTSYLIPTVSLKTQHKRNVVQMKRRCMPRQNIPGTYYYVNVTPLFPLWLYH